jgi:hypothetical protein
VQTVVLLGSIDAHQHHLPHCTNNRRSYVMFLFFDRIFFLFRAGESRDFLMN